MVQNIPSCTTSNLIKWRNHLYDHEQVELGKNVSLDPCFYMLDGLVLKCSGPLTVYSLNYIRRDIITSNKLLHHHITSKLSLSLLYYFKYFLLIAPKFHLSYYLLSLFFFLFFYWAFISTLVCNIV